MKDTRQRVAMPKPNDLVKPSACLSYFPVGTELLSVATAVTKKCTTLRRLLTLLCVSSILSVVSCAFQSTTLSLDGVSLVFYGSNG